MSHMNYYQVSKIYIGVTDFGKIEYHVEAGVNNITGIGKTLEEAFEDLEKKLQHYVKSQFSLED